jgi:hypothetical protein
MKGDREVYWRGKLEGYVETMETLNFFSGLSIELRI